MEYKNKKLEEFENFIKNKKIAIIGLGVSNTPLLDYFYNLNVDISIFDKKGDNLLLPDIKEKIQKYDVKTYVGDNYLENLNGFDIIFRSPSCRPDLPEIQAEVERGAILTSEIEMVMKLCPGKIIGVTGSDGKTTTTSLIYEIIKAKGSSSTFSAANAARNHLKDWCYGNEKIVSMGVVSDGDYDIPKELVSSFPIKCKGNWNYEVIKGIELNDNKKEKIKKCVKDLQCEASEIVI